MGEILFVCIIPFSPQDCKRTGYSFFVTVSAKASHYVMTFFCIFSGFLIKSDFCASRIEKPLPTETEVIRVYPDIFSRTAIRQ